MLTYRGTELSVTCASLVVATHTTVMRHRPPLHAMCEIGHAFFHIILEDHTEEANALFDLVSSVYISKVVPLTLLDHVSGAGDIFMN